VGGGWAFIWAVMGDVWGGALGGEYVVFADLGRPLIPRSSLVFFFLVPF